MARGIGQRILGFGLVAFCLADCAQGEEITNITPLKVGNDTTSTSAGSGGSLAAGGAAGDFTESTTGTGGGTGGSGSEPDASAGGQGGQGQAGSGLADANVPEAITYPPCTTCSLSLQYSNQRTADPTQEIGFNMIVKNTGNKATPMNQIAVRYWYTIDGEASQESAIDYTSASPGTIGFVKVMPPRTGADYYAEIKLTGSGDLAVGATAQLNLRFHKAGYQGTYKQMDDYSFGAGQTAFGDWPKMTVYVAGAAMPVYGTEP